MRNSQQYTVHITITTYWTNIRYQALAKKPYTSMGTVFIPGNVHVDYLIVFVFECYLFECLYCCIATQAQKYDEC